MDTRLFIIVALIICAASVGVVHNRNHQATSPTQCRLVWTNDSTSLSGTTDWAPITRKAALEKQLWNDRTASMGHLTGKIEEK